MNPDSPTLSVMVDGATVAESRPAPGVEYVSLQPDEAPGVPTVPVGLCWNEAAGRASGDILVFTAPGRVPPTESLRAIAQFFAREPRAAALTDFNCRVALLAVRREAFAAAGGFDESLPPGCADMHSLVMDLSRDGAAVRAAETPGGSRERGRTPGFLCRQWRLGFASRYARRRPAYPKAGGSLLRQATARTARAVGRATSRLVGGERRSGAASPLVGPMSEELAGEDGGCPDISVVLPAYGHFGCTGFALAALCRQDMDVPYEIVVVTDRDSEVAGRVRRHWPRARLARCEPADGPGGARNRGMEAARGDYVAFTDADCIADRDWLRRLVDACRGNDGGPTAGWLDTAYPWSPVARATNAVQLGMLRPRSRCGISGLWGASMCVGAALLRETGARFAEGRYGAEEMAFLHSLGERGRSVLLEPTARVRHLRREGLLSSVGHQYRLGRGIGRTRREFPLRGSAFARHPWLAPLLVPGRFLLLTGRTLRHNPGAAVELLRLAPLVLAQLVGYAAGFRAGARTTTAGEP